MNYERTVKAVDRMGRKIVKIERAINILLAFYKKCKEEKKEYKEALEELYKYLRGVRRNGRI